MHSMKSIRCSTSVKKHLAVGTHHKHSLRHTLDAVKKCIPEALDIRGVQDEDDDEVPPPPPDEPMPSELDQQLEMEAITAMDQHIQVPHASDTIIRQSFRIHCPASHVTYIAVSAMESMRKIFMRSLFLDVVCILIPLDQ